MTVIRSPIRPVIFSPIRQPTTLYKGGGLTFDFYVDSVAGDDGNDGLTRATALQTLTAAAALLSNDSSLGLATDSTWLDSIDKPSLTGVRIGTYGNGEKPVIDCADPLTGWAAGAEPNVYKVTGVVLTGVTNVYVTVQEDQVLLQRVTSEALCSARPGSCYVTGDTGTVDIYVHASDSGDPASNGKDYGYSARLYAIRLGDGANVSGVETLHNRHNDGSIVLGANSKLTGCRMRNGHKHNALVGYGSQVRHNEFLEGHYHVDSGIQLVVYSPGAVSGAPDTYIEYNTFKARGLLAAPTLCIYAHTSGGNGGTNVYIRHNAFVDCFAAIYAATSNIAGDNYFEDNDITFSEAFATLPSNLGDPYITAGKYVRRNQVFFPEPWATTFTAKNKLFEGGATKVFEDNLVNSGPYFNWVLGATAGTPNWEVRRNKVATIAGYFLYSQAANNTLTACEDNEVAAPTRLIELRNTATVVSCDNNHWSAHNGSPFRLGGTNYTWAQWVALGWDVASDAAPDTKAAGVAPAATALGNIRDWPDIWLHVNAQETASITESGGFVSAVSDLARGGRDLTLHEPSPGTDKVSLTMQGGLPWFAPVANGGLRTGNLDYSAQISLAAAVVRLNNTLSAASARQNIAILNSSDQLGMILGSFSASAANEIISGFHGGANGWYYGDAAQSFAANTPHLFLIYYDPITDLTYLKVDGVLIGAMTPLSVITRFAIQGAKGSPIELLRGQASVNKLDGYLGELMFAGPSSVLMVSEIETEMMARWGID